jgi:RNA polymerase sigma-54 factor
MATPRGIFEMKYFFSPGIKTLNGNRVSNKTVLGMIEHLIANEDPFHPLSDQEIAARLREQGVDVARRTVAKYRVLLHIPSSHLRYKSK